MRGQMDGEGSQMTRRSLQAVTDGAWSLTLTGRVAWSRKWGAGGVLPSEVGWVRSTLQCSGNGVYSPEGEPL